MALERVQKSTWGLDPQSPLDEGMRVNTEPPRSPGPCYAIQNPACRAKRGCEEMRA